MKPLKLSLAEALMISAETVGDQHEFPEYLIRSEGSYALSRELYGNGTAIATYYPSLDVDEQLLDAVAFFHELCNIVAAKGFDPSTGSYISIKDCNSDYVTDGIIYYGAPDDRKSVYLGNHLFDYSDLYHMYQSRGQILAKVNGLPTLKEMRLKEMLEMIAKVQEMAEDFEVPADFINPLTLMAEQLRTNIIEDKRQVGDDDHGTFDAF